MRIEEVLSEAQEARIVDAIRAAEARTSGEIRVLLEPDCDGDALARAKKVFAKLGMHRTARRNGVLIYVAFESRTCAIFADEGLFAATEPDFWKREIEAMVARFRAGDVEGGLMHAVADVADVLAAQFPPDAISTADNELSDAISR